MKENSRRYRMPAIVDLHDHLRDMGQEHKETFESGTKAALAGGITLVIDKPNKLKPIFTLEDLQEEIQVAQSRIFCDVGFDFGSDGKNLDEFPRIKQLTNRLKVFLNETTGHLKLDNPTVLLPKIYKAWPEDGLIFLHAEDDMVPLAIRVIEETRRKTHFHHISTKRDLMPILLAKKRGLPVTCGVTPHHLFLSKDDVKKLGRFGYMKPELATQEDIDYLWKNMEEEIDVVETDHAPHTVAEKNSEKPPSGVTGLETMLPLMLTAVAQGRLTMGKLIELISINPQKILGIKLPDSTYTVVDLNKKYVISDKGLETKCGWTPYDGMKVQGKVKTVYVRGKKVFDSGKVLVSPGFGKVIFPNCK
jgi:dihydroorotase